MTRIVKVMTLGMALVVTLSAAQQKVEIKARYGVEANAVLYPQESAKETLASVLTAYKKDRVSYLLAHLVDPTWVDDRVRKVHGGDFDLLVKEVKTKIRDNPESLKELNRFLKEGEWDGDEKSATAKVKDSPRLLFFKKIGSRWFMENRMGNEK